VRRPRRPARRESTTCRKITGVCTRIAAFRDCARAPCNLGERANSARIIEMKDEPPSRKLPWRRALRTLVRYADCTFCGHWRSMHASWITMPTRENGLSLALVFNLPLQIRGELVSNEIWTEEHWRIRWARQPFLHSWRPDLLGRFVILHPQHGQSCFQEGSSIRLASSHGFQGRIVVMTRWTDPEQARWGRRVRS
jgi:hypothetical protein